MGPERVQLYQLCVENYLSGSVIVDGISIDNHKEHISRSVGVVFQNSLLDKDLTVYENLKYRAGLYGIFGSSFER